MTVEPMVITTAGGMMAGIAEAMTVIDTTTAETFTIIVKAMKIRNQMLEL